MYEEKIQIEPLGDEVDLTACSLLVILKKCVVNFITRKFSLNSLFTQDPIELLAVLAKAELHPIPNAEYPAIECSDDVRTEWAL